MQVIDIKIYLKKWRKTQRTSKKPFSLHGIKMGITYWLLAKIVLIKMPSIKIENQLIWMK